MKSGRPRLERLPLFDYSREGSYFITINTHNREHLFGEIRDEKWIPSEFGEIALVEWLEMADKRKMVRLGAFEIMPDHMHGILIIDKEAIIENDCKDSDTGGAIAGYGTTLNPKPSKIPNFVRADFSQEIAIKRSFGKMPANSVSSIIRSFKSAVTGQINILRGTEGDPVWQSNFYEHIIRSQEEFDRITRYTEREQVFELFSKKCCSL